MKPGKVLFLLATVVFSISFWGQQSLTPASPAPDRSKASDAKKKTGKSSKSADTEQGQIATPTPPEAKVTPSAQVKAPDAVAAANEQISLLARRLSTAIIVAIILAIALGVLLVMLLARLSSFASTQQLEDRIAALARAADLNQSTQQLLQGLNALQNTAATAQALQAAVNPLSLKTDVTQARNDLLQNQQQLAQSLLEFRNALQQALAQLAQSLLETRAALQQSIEAHSPKG